MLAITAKELTKRYRLGGVRHNSLRDALAGLIGRAGRGDEMTALDGVSFDIDEGERVGIIGRNGAGKSTLLKVLSRITRPSSGTAEIRGRVGSLLEVGTGFHNELSGRENIFLNGAILGMKRAEIAAKFDEIVAFSEMERFLDTPVKHYSSGMYMRLAFAVAAHLDPEVLIVDEVLAVGDISFQRKCLAKMRSAGESGRTVLFVSHDMSAITRLCDRAIWIKDGRVASDGRAEEVVAAYLHEQSETGSERTWAHREDAPGNDAAWLRGVRIIDDKHRSISSSDIRKPVGIEMTYEVTAPDKILVPNFHFYNDQGVCLFISHDWYSGWRDRPRPIGTYKSIAWIPGDLLAEGTVFVTVALSTYEPLIVHFVERDAVTFTVTDTLDGDSVRGDYAGVLPGVVRPKLDWETETVPTA